MAEDWKIISSPRNTDYKTFLEGKISPKVRLLTYIAQETAWPDLEQFWPLRQKIKHIVNLDVFFVIWQILNLIWQMMLGKVS